MSMDMLLQNLKQTNQDQLNEALVNIYGNLVENTTSVYNKIPESLFKNYFLPYFLGQKQDNSNWILEWVSIAGTPTSPVNVFQDLTGEIVYTVPSLLDSNNILVPRSNSDITSIMKAANLYNNNLPIVGTKFLIDALNDKAKNLPSQNVSQNVQMWNYILTRYGYISSPTVNSSTSSLDDFFER